MRIISVSLRSGRLVQHRQPVVFHLLPVLAGRHFLNLHEGPVKGAGVFKAALEADLLHAQVIILQKHAGMLDAQGIEKLPEVMKKYGITDLKQIIGGAH